jgi:acyl carrier protein
MDQKSVLKFIKNIIIASSGKKTIKLSINSSSKNIKEWDSLVTMTLASTLNSEYNLNLNIDDLEKISSVKGIFKLLKL